MYTTSNTSFLPCKLVSALDFLFYDFFFLNNASVMLNALESLSLSIKIDWSKVRVYTERDEYAPTA